MLLSCCFRVAHGNRGNEQMNRKRKPVVFNGFKRIKTEAGIEINSPWLTISEAAEYCGVSLNYFRRRIEASRLKTYGFGKLRRFNTMILDRWMFLQRHSYHTNEGGKHDTTDTNNGPLGAEIRGFDDDRKKV